MARLRDGNLFLRRWDRTPERRLGSALALLICTSIGLLALSRFAEDKIAAANWRVAAWAAPALDAVTAPVDTLRAIGRAVSAHFGLVDELQSLKTENQKLASWEWRARQLEAKIADIEALAKVVPEQRLEFITSRVIAQSSGLFAKSVIIGAGSRQRVTTDFPVINADGLIGRVVDVATDTARVLLITDARSRIPVVVGPDAVAAVIAGDGTSTPRLMSIANGKRIALGDAVSTSNAGGPFPSGLRIGIVAGSLGEPRVMPRADLDQLEYVSVLFFDNPWTAFKGDAPLGVANDEENKDAPTVPSAKVEP